MADVNFKDIGIGTEGSSAARSKVSLFSFRFYSSEPRVTKSTLVFRNLTEEILVPYTMVSEVSF